MKLFPLSCLCLALGLSACSSTPRGPKSSVVVRWARDPEAIDALALPNQQAIDAANLLHCSLLQIDYQTGQFAPALAETLPTVERVGDSLTRLTYRLRPAAAWDNGQPVLAHDVAFTLKLMQCPGLPNEYARAQFGFIRSVELDSVDPRRFALLCRGQAPEYAQTSGDFFVLPEAVLDSAHALRRYSLAALQDRPTTAPADAALQALARRYAALDPAHHPERLPGCGAYRLARWQTNRSLAFRRKPRWWADGLRPAPFVLQARPVELRYLVIPDDATAALALRRHELDVYPQVPAREFRRLQASAAARRELAFYTTPSYDVLMAGFNTRRPALHDRLTRQALSRLFDPAGLLAATQLGQGRRTAGLVHPADRRHYNDSLPLPALDPDAAARLLGQAGWRRAPGGSWRRPAAQPGRLVQTLALTLRYRADETTYETVALQFRAAAARLGIPVELRSTEASALTAALQAGDFDVYVRTLKGNPFVFNFAPILHSQAVGEGNFTGFGTPATDRLIEAVAAADRPARKRALLRRFQAMLQEEAPLVPLFFLSNRLAADRRLRRLYPSGLKPGYAATALSWGDSTSLAAR